LRRAADSTEGEALAGLPVRPCEAQVLYFQEAERVFQLLESRE